MGLIDIIDVDDRDTNYYIEGQENGAVATAKIDMFKEWLVRLQAELPPETKVFHLGNGLYKIDLPLITGIGSDVENIYNMPFMNEFQKMEIKHVDSSNVDSANALDYSIAHRHPPNLWMLMLSIAGSVSSDIVDEYTDYRLMRGAYRVTTNTTATDLLYISLYIKITGE